MSRRDQGTAPISVRSYRLVSEGRPETYLSPNGRCSRCLGSSETRRQAARRGATPTLGQTEPPSGRAGKRSWPGGSVFHPEPAKASNAWREWLEVAKRFVQIDRAD
jgi:hypothetical protein